MCDRIREVVNKLGGKFITNQFPYEGVAPRFVDDDQTIQVMDRGRSYHEAGTLRMGTETDHHSVTDHFGKVQGIDNLFVADGSLFPCVGIANPMLTITALAYRTADNLPL